MRSHRNVLACAVGSGIALLLLFLNACTDPTPTKYSMHTPFGFGNTQITIDSTESTEDMNKKSILVHLRMTNLDGASQARVASQSWDQWFKLTDRKGKKYKCFRFQPTDYYYQNFHYAGRGGEQVWSNQDKEDIFSSVPSDWIMHFDVPVEAEGFTLLLNNMTFHQGSQPIAIAVPLDR